jgi:hypothetical protein
MQPVESETPLSGLSLRQAALIAGLAYLLNPVSFAEFYLMPRLVSANAATTVQNLSAHPNLLAAAIVSYLVSALGDVVLAWSLYHLLAPVNRALALLGSVLQWVYAAAWLAAISNLGVLYRLVAVPDYSSQITPAELPTQAVQLLAGFRSGWGMDLIFFGLHLVVIGWLITRSTYIPRWLGWLLIAAGCGWVVNSLGLYLYPHANLDFLQIIFAGELVFMVWLLGWGWRIQPPTQEKVRPLVRLSPIE